MSTPTTTTLIGHALRRLRVQRGISQAQLARDAGLSRSYLIHVEAGTKGASRDTLLKITEALALPDRKTDIICLLAGYSPTDQTTQRLLAELRAGPPPQVA